MDKPSIRSGMLLPVTFLQEVIGELKKVTWPSRDETIKLTGMVIIISVLVAFFVGGLDALFLSLTGLVLK